MDDQHRAQLVAELVEQHYQMLYRYAYRLTGAVADAEDLTQQGFLQAYEKLDQLRDPALARFWLCTIVRNLFLKAMRSRPAATTVSLDVVPDPEEAVPLEDPVDEELLQTVLGELDEEFRTPLILFYFEDFSYREIAEQMGVPTGTVMSRLSRAKAYLRRRLAELQPTSATR